MKKKERKFVGMASTQTSLYFNKWEIQKKKLRKLLIFKIKNQYYGMVKN